MENYELNQKEIKEIEFHERKYGRLPWWVIGTTHDEYIQRRVYDATTTFQPSPQSCAKINESNRDSSKSASTRLQDEITREISNTERGGKNPRFDFVE